MVSQSYRSVLEAEILRDYRLPRSASFCARHLDASHKACTRPGGTGAELPAAPRKLGKKASSRRLVAKVIEVPLQRAEGGGNGPRERRGVDLRRIGSTRLLTEAKSSKQKPAKASRDATPSDAVGGADRRAEKKQTESNVPQGTALRRGASTKRLLKSKASTRKLAIVDVIVKGAEVESSAREISFVPQRADRAPGPPPVRSIFYGSGRAKPPAAASRRVTFLDVDRVVRVEFAFDECEYRDFPEVPSYEHLDHEEYYEAMAEMVAELNGRTAPGRCRRHDEFTVCHAEDEATNKEITVCFADEPSNDDDDGAAEAAATPNSSGIAISVSASPPLHKPPPPQDAGGDASTTSDTLPLSQDDESYLPDSFRSRSPRGATDGGPYPRGPSFVPPSAEALIPRTVIYQSLETKKRRRSALSMMKRTLKIVSL